MVDKSPIKGAQSGSRDPFYFFLRAPNDISGTPAARVVKFCAQVDYHILA